MKAMVRFVWLVALMVIITRISEVWPIFRSNIAWLGVTKGFKENGLSSCSIVLQPGKPDKLESSKIELAGDIENCYSGSWACASTRRALAWRVAMAGDLQGSSSLLSGLPYLRPGDLMLMALADPETGQHQPSAMWSLIGADRLALWYAHCANDLQSSGYPEKARDAIQFAVQLAPEAPNVWYLKARLHQTQGELDSALIAYAQAAKLDPSNSLYLSMQANALYAVHPQQVQDAIGLLKQSLVLDPNNYLSALLLGRIYRDLGHFHYALHYLGLAASVSPSSSNEALVSIADVYLRMGEFDLAGQVLSQELRRNLDDAQLLYLNAQLALYESRSNSALEFCERALILQPSMVECYIIRGIAHTSLHQYDKAKASFQRALTLVPNYKDAVDGLRRIDELKRQIKP